jgi:hypothetical protein
MKLSEEQLALIEKMGANFFSYKEAAIVLEVDEVTLKKALSDKSHPAYKRYFKGKFTSELELRESISKMAKRGSNPAQKMLLDLLQSTNMANL